VVLSRNKPASRKNQILLINASAYFVKEKPKNELTNEGITVVTELFHRWEAREKLSSVVTLEQIREADYNLAPSLFVEINDKRQHRSLAEIEIELLAARNRRAQADAHLDDVLRRLASSSNHADRGSAQ
jgi:type I restriction enzyme M protein